MLHHQVVMGNCNLCRTNGITRSLSGIDRQARRSYFRDVFSAKNGEPSELSRGFWRENRPKRASLAPCESIPGRLLATRILADFPPLVGQFLRFIAFHKSSSFSAVARKAPPMHEHKAKTANKGQSVKGASKVTRPDAEGCFRHIMALPCRNVLQGSARKNKP